MPWEGPVTATDRIGTDEVPSPPGGFPPARVPRILVAALVVGLTVESMGVLFPIVYALRERSGVLSAAGAAVVVFAAPVLTGPLVQILGGRSTLVVTGLALAGTRLAMQFVRPIPLWLPAMAVGAGLVGLAVLAHAAAAEGRRLGVNLAMGIVLGLVLAVSVAAGAATWDPVWRDGAIAALVGIMLAGALAVASIAWARAATVSRGARAIHTLGDAVVGPFLFLEWVFLANVGFLAASGGLGLLAAACVAIAGLGLAALGVAATGGGRWLARSRAVLAVALVVLVTYLGWASATGLAVVVVALVAQPLAGTLLAMGLARGGDGSAGPWRSGFAIALGTLLFVALAFGWQIWIQYPIFPRLAVPLAASVLLAAAALGTAPGWAEAPHPWRWLAVPLGALVAVPVILSTSAHGVERAGPGLSIPHTATILDWNTHSAVDAQGQVDPTPLLDLVAGPDPSRIAILQEVARGMPIAGGIDLAAYLSQGSGEAFAWAPAADRQFGNVVLTALPMGTETVTALPYGDGPQHRSMLTVPVTLPDGPVLTVIATHLEYTAGSTTRHQQIERLLSKWGGAAPAVIVGDLNLQHRAALPDPNAPANIALFLRAGLVSAQEAAGRAAASCSKEPDFPGDCPDWIWATPDLRLTGFEVLRGVTLSDHLPLEVTVGAPAL